MSATVSDDVLLSKAVSGDEDSLMALLLSRYGKLQRFLARQVPEDLQGRIEPEDVIQDVHIEVFRTIQKFDDRGPDSFDRWLFTISRQRLLDHFKGLRRKKRGGEHHRVRKAATPGQSSLGTIVDLVAHASGTPSRSVARKERERAVKIALAGMKSEYRDALQLRYIDGLPVAEVAKKLGKTDRAVHMLCNRGLKRLREHMGSASRYLSSG